MRARKLAGLVRVVYVHFRRCDQRSAHLNSSLSARFKVGLRLNHGQHDEAPLEGPSPPTPQKKTSRLIGSDFIPTDWTKSVVLGDETSTY